MKKFFRAVIKLLCLPVAVLFFSLMIVASYVIDFFEWIYEVKQSDFNKSINNEILNDLKQGLKNSFKIF